MLRSFRSEIRRTPLLWFAASLSVSAALGVALPDLLAAAGQLLL